MKIHSLCVVKNEADVIGYCLQSAIEWADHIFVYDNGSTDGTWDIVQSFKSDKVIAWRSDDRPFRDSIRGQIFNEFRSMANPGDWWCRLDADEVYVSSPKEFLERVPRRYYVVWATMIHYFITHEDIDQIDFGQPIAKILDELRYYKADFAEPRFFRHRNRLEWPTEASWPAHMGVSCPDRLLMKHYKYRSPQQIRARLATRSQANRRGHHDWGRTLEMDWMEAIAQRNGLHKDNQDGHFVFEGTPADHLEPTLKRGIKHLMHGLGLWP